MPVWRISAGVLVAIGGLNQDPYTDDGAIARLRHLYVRTDLRRFGIGRLLVMRIVDEAAKTFAVLRIRTTTAEAASFYESLGFQMTDENGASHRMQLSRTIAS